MIFVCENCGGDFRGVFSIDFCLDCIVRHAVKQAVVRKGENRWGCTSFTNAPSPEIGSARE